MADRINTVRSNAAQLRSVPEFEEDRVTVPDTAAPAPVP